MKQQSINRIILLQMENDRSFSLYLEITHKYNRIFHTWILIGSPGSFDLLRPIGTTVAGNPTALNIAW